MLQALQLPTVRILELSDINLAWSIWSVMLPCMAKTMRHVHELSISVQHSYHGSHGFSRPDPVSHLPEYGRRTALLLRSTTRRVPLPPPHPPTRPPRGHERPPPTPNLISVSTCKTDGSVCMIFLVL